MNQISHRIFTLICAMFISLNLFQSLSQAANNPPAEGEKFPEIRLAIPQKADDTKYLGLDNERFFQIPEVKAELVLVEVFSMYCPFCQKEAPAVNNLYELVQSDQNLSKKIKLLGIGVGNSNYEVETFGKHYAVPFPLLPDPDYKIHDAMGQVRTPYFIAVRIFPDGSHKVVYSQAGGFGDAKEFLSSLLSKAKMK